MFYFKFLLLKKLINFLILLFILFILILSCLTIYYSIRLLKIFFIQIYQFKINLSALLFFLELISKNFIYVFIFYSYNNFLFNKNFILLFVINFYLIIYIFDLLLLFIF